MKRSGKLLILLAVLVVLAAATFAVTRLTADTGTAAEEAETYTVLSLDADAVTELSWTCGGETIRLTKDESGWSDPDDPAFPVDETGPNSMVSVLTEITADRMLEDPEDLSAYGLSDPAYVVEVTAGETHTLSIGNETDLGGEVYVSNGDGNVYLSDSALLTAFAYDRYDIVKMESIPDMSEISDITVSAGDNLLTLTYLEGSGITYTDQYVWFGGSDNLPLGTSETEAFVSAVTGISWLSCADYNAEDLGVYGLDTPSAAVTVDYLETVTVETGETDDDGNIITEERQQDASFTLELGDTYEAACYARISGSRMVYLVSADLLDTLRYTSYEELRSSEVFPVDWDGITGFDMILGGQTYAVTFTEETAAAEDSDEAETGTEETVFYLGDEKLDTDAVETLLGLVAGLNSTGSASAAESGRDAEIRFIFHQDSDTWPDVELALYPYDSSSCLTEAAGEARLLVSRSAVTDILAAAEAVLPG